MTTVSNTELQSVELPLAGMTCAACAARIEKQLNKLPGVEAAVNFATERATIRYASAGTTAAKLVETIRKTGFEVPLATLDLAIGGMTCAACATRIEKQLNKLEGVEAAVNLAAEKAHIRYVPGLADPERLVATVVKTGFTATVSGNDTRAEEKARKLAVYHEELRRFWISAALTLPLVAQMVFMFAQDAHADVLPRWLQLLLATPVQFWIGWRFYVGGYNAVRGGAGNMDVLVALGTTMAWAFSFVVTVADLHHQHVYYEASATVITLVLLGKILEARAKAKTSAAIEALARLQPQTARVERRVGDKLELVDVPVATLIPGDIFVVRAGEAVPVDGEVIEGNSSANEAMLTGESLPVAKAAGDKLFAATINGDGLLALPRHRRRQPHPSGRHHPAGRAGAGLQGAGAAPGRQGGGDFRSRRYRHRSADLRCLVGAVRRFHPGAGECGGRAGDRLPLRAGPGDADRDHGRHRAGRPCRCADPQCRGAGARGETRRAGGGQDRHADRRPAGRDRACHRKSRRWRGGVRKGYRPRTAVDITLLQLAASLEQGSTHPLAAAIVARAKADSLDPGDAARGDDYRRARRRRRSSPANASPSARSRGLPSARGRWRRRNHLPNPGAAWSVLPSMATWLGAIAIADPLRSTFRCSCASPQGLGIEVVMLTGDNAATARTVAREAGILHFEAEVLPGDKAATVNKLKATGRLVGMAGDGINDAPALAAADVSFAMAAGSDVAMQAADVTLMRDDLGSVADAISLSRATLAKIRQNLFFAFIYNVLGIPLAALGMLNPVIAGAAMAMSSVSVVSNSLLLKNWNVKKD
jgi:Cu+-exporting ATPase